MNNIQLKIKQKIVEVSNLGLTDKATFHSYEELYPYLLEESIGKKLNILEVGVAKGGGLRILSELFPESNIYGLDISYNQLEIKVQDTNIKLLPENDQGNPDFNSALPNLDLVIEDASHDYHKSMETFNIIKSKLNQNAIYIIEDIFPQYKSFYDNDERFKIYDLTQNKNRLDDVVAVYIHKK
jgi:predicted rRNA methylase YqxC with S4 and FtsJ domains